MTHLTINGKPIEVPDGTTVLRAAEMAGITIPTLCDHPHLTPYGGCRLCVVDVKGARLPMASCTLPVSEGMVVLELLLSNYHDAAYNNENADTQLTKWVKFYGLDVTAAQAKAPRYPVD